MGTFRLRRTVKIAPGLRVNISKSGPSVTAGRRGAKVTIGTKGGRTTVGVPGTGLSYTETVSRRSAPKATALSGRSATPDSLASMTPAQLEREMERRARELEATRRAVEVDRKSKDREARKAQAAASNGPSWAKVIAVGAAGGLTLFLGLLVAGVLRF